MVAPAGREDMAHGHTIAFYKCPTLPHTRPSTHLLERVGPHISRFGREASRDDDKGHPGKNAQQSLRPPLPSKEKAAREGAGETMIPPAGVHLDCVRPFGFSWILVWIADTPCPDRPETGEHALKP